MANSPDDSGRGATLLLQRCGGRRECDEALGRDLDAVLERKLRHELAELARIEEPLDAAARRLACAWLTAAIEADPGEHWFHYWSSELLRAGMPATATRLRREVQERITLGINLRGRSDEEFLAARLHVDEHDAEASDLPALDALRVALATSSFCSADLPRALMLAGRCEPARNGGRHLLAVLAGGYYGRERLLANWPRELAGPKEDADERR